jgi:fructokinase
MTALVIGEVLVDLVWRTGGASLVPLPGGSPVNVAVGLHRLERCVRVVTCWGDDPAGELVGAHLDRVEVPVERAKSASDRTTLALAYVDEATGAANYDFLTAWDPDHLPVPDDTVLLHTGSLAIVLEPGAERVRAAARTLRSRPGGVVAIDLNVRPAAQPDRAAYRRAVDKIIEEADVVKASDEDLAWLYPQRSSQETAKDLLARGPRMVVVTCGSDGAFGLIDGAMARVGAPEVTVLDTIGAGDSFQAAMLAALLEPTADGISRVSLPQNHDALEQVLRRAVTAGALACTRAGAQPPSRAQLDAVLGPESTVSAMQG